jgi:non-ribosomal peptide synthetase component F
VTQLSSLSASVVFGALTVLQTDLALVVSHDEPHPRLSLHYDRSVFQPGTIARFAESLCRASSTFWEHPELPLGDFPLLSDEQTRRQLAAWSGPLAESGDRALHRYVVDQAQRTPSATAVSFRDRHLTYGELERRSRRLALLLQGQGGARGARVAVCLEPSLDTVICLLGVMRAGATYVPLDPGYPVERLRLMLADTGAEVLLTQRALASALPAVKHRLCVEDLLDDPFEPGVLDDAVGLEQMAYVIYTSGTTGTPKGVAVSHRNLCHYVMSARRKYGFCGSDVMPAMARSTFSITMFEMFSMLVVGGRLVVLGTTCSIFVA